MANTDAFSSLGGAFSGGGYSPPAVDSAAGAVSNIPADVGMPNYSAGEIPGGGATIPSGVEAAAPQALEALGPAATGSPAQDILQAGGQAKDIPGATPTSGGGGSILGSIGDAAKTAAPLAVDALKLGTGALGAYSGLSAAKQMGQQEKLLANAQKQQAATAAPAVAFAGSELSQAQQGQIPQSQQQVIQNWTQQAKAQLHQKLADLGMTDSTTMAEYDAYIDQQAAELTNQALQAEQGLGLQAVGAATGATGGAAGTASGQAATLEQAITQANQNIAKLAGLG